MANVNTAYGLRWKRCAYGNASPATIECLALSGAGTLERGDAVILAAATATGDGRPAIDAAAGSEGTPDTNLFGVVLEFLPTGPDDLASLTRGANGTQRVVRVIPALPSYIWEVNPDAAVDELDVANGFDLVVAGGSNGVSGTQLDVGAAGATGRQLRLLGFSRRPDNSISASTGETGTDCLVTIAESFWHTGGAGV